MRMWIGGSKIKLLAFIYNISVNVQWNDLTSFGCLSTIIFLYLLEGKRNGVKFLIQIRTKKEWKNPETGITINESSMLTTFIYNIEYCLLILFVEVLIAYLTQQEMANLAYIN
ncbi:hypothetical protein ACJX0J_033221 [Zea mays]